MSTLRTLYTKARNALFAPTADPVAVHDDIMHTFHECMIEDMEALRVDLDKLRTEFDGTQQPASAPPASLPTDTGKDPQAGETTEADPA